MKRLLLLGVIATTAVLAGCSSSKTTEPKDPSAYVNSNPSVMNCVEGTGANTSCVEGNIESITNTWVKQCIQTNIGEKSALVTRMENGAMSTGDVKDIDELAKECLNYFALQQEKENLSATAAPSSSAQYPVFNGFLSSFGGSFLGSYMANSMFSNRGFTYNSFTDYRDYRGRYETERRRSGGGAFVSRPYIGSSATSYERSAATKKASGTYKLGNAGKSWVGKSSSVNFGSKSSSAGRSTLG